LFQKKGPLLFGPCLCRVALHSDPFSGQVFVFGNRRRQAIKILVYDGQGF
jgi:transposase